MPIFSMRHLLGMGCVPATLALAACISAASPDARAINPDDPAAVARGEAVAAQWCAQCHARDATERAARPDIAGAGPSFSEIVALPGRDAGTLRAFLDEDHFPMTTYRLFPQEKDDVVAYMLSLGE
jgi:mono/diheme cytochrome c family protein